MRYALYFEFAADPKKVYERNEKILTDKEKNPDDYPEDVIPCQGHIFGKQAGFYLVEGTYEQVFHFIQAWKGTKDFNVVPVTDAYKLAPLAKKAHSI
jgi:hypothetical protein